MMTVEVKDFMGSEFYVDRRLVVEVPVEFSINDRKTANLFYDNWRLYRRLPPDYPNYQEEFRILRRIISMSDLEIWQRMVDGKPATFLRFITRVKPKSLPGILKLIRDNLGSRVIIK